MYTKIIWGIRHGENNRQVGLQAGIDDCDLSENGFRQADTLRERLKGLDPEVIFVSTMRRAQQTFIRAGVTAPRMEADSRTVELGHLHPDIAGIHDPLSPLLARDRHDAAMTPDEGHRVAAFLEDLLACPERKIMVFSHGAFLSRLLIRFLGAPEPDWTALELANTGMVKMAVTASGERKCLLWNAWTDWPGGDAWALNP